MAGSRVDKWVKAQLAPATKPARRPKDTSTLGRHLPPPNAAQVAKRAKEDQHALDIMHASAKSEQANALTAAIEKKIAEDKPDTQAEHVAAGQAHREAASAIRAVGNGEKIERLANEHGDRATEHEVAADEYNRDEQGRFAAK